MGVVREAPKSKQWNGATSSQVVRESRHRAGHMPRNLHDGVSHTSVVPATAPESSSTTALLWTDIF